MISKLKNIQNHLINVIKIFSLTTAVLNILLEYLADFYAAMTTAQRE